MLFPEGVQSPSVGVPGILPRRCIPNQLQHSGMQFPCTRTLCTIPDTSACPSNNLIVLASIHLSALCTTLALLAPSTDRIPLATTKSLPSVLLQLCSSSRGSTEPLPRHGPPPHRISDNAPAVARETDLSCSRTRTDGGIRRAWRPRPNAPSVQMM